VIEIFICIYIIRKKLHREGMMMIMMMVMVVGFAYKLGKSSDERKRN
jgi:hypothetical protein